MDKELVFTTPKDFKDHCDKNPDRVYVIYKKGVYDVTDYLDDHPGGAAYIYDYQNKDISEVYHSDDTHEHSSTALRTMQKYRIGRVGS